MSTDENQTAQERRPIVSRALAFAALIAALGLAAVYWTRPDSCAAITVCPPWIWCLPAFMVLLALSIRRTAGWLLGAAWLAWIVYLPATADTPWALVRGISAPAIGEAVKTPPDKIHVRVLSLNCGGFGRRSADDVLDYDPQIVLLQESPGPPAVAALASDLFGARGEYLWTPDASIVADGSVEMLPVHEPRDSKASLALVRLANGVEVAVVSLRLKQAIVRLDYWSPACWRSQTRNRQLRREQLREITAKVATISPDVPLVLGGDFNAPAGDAVLRELAPRLHDSFRDAGVGWGNTIVNEFPFARIDQIWIDKHWHAAAVRAQRTRHSDHRMVVADLWLDQPTP